LILHCAILAFQRWCLLACVGFIYTFSCLAGVRTVAIANYEKKYLQLTNGSRSFYFIANMIIVEPNQINQLGSSIPSVAQAQARAISHRPKWDGTDSYWVWLWWFDLTLTWLWPETRYLASTLCFYLYPKGTFVEAGREAGVLLICMAVWRWCSTGYAWNTWWDVAMMWCDLISRHVFIYFSPYSGLRDFYPLFLMLD